MGGQIKLLSSQIRLTSFTLSLSLSPSLLLFSTHTLKYKGSSHTDRPTTLFLPHTETIGGTVGVNTVKSQ